MQSSQALTQSVFGTIEVLDRRRLLSAIKAEDGRPAFCPIPSEITIDLERETNTLGEQPKRSTSVDVWFGGTYRVAVECKLAEPEFGTCSRTRLKSKNKEFETQHCDGNYMRQRGRSERCALTEIKVNYWKYLGDLFGWPSELDHRPCPLNRTYQLVRNVLAACVNDDGSLDTNTGHALIIYDQRNPAMAADGICDIQWRAAYEALKNRGLLRRLSWQAFMAQWPNDAILDWLKTELRAKYALQSSSN
jgi:hypothetical protein